MSTYKKVNVPASGSIFVSGIASSYDENFYDPILTNILLKSELASIISNINDGLESFWPCSPCVLFGYGCIICTIGMSLACPAYCISEAEKEVNRLLDDYNRQPKYADRNIKFKLKKGSFSSSIEISFPSILSQSSSSSSSSSLSN